MSTTAVPQKKIIGKECRFATFVEPPEFGKPDLHAVKEIVYYDDGTKEPNLHFVWDYKRPYWVTKPGRRNHKQKKEWAPMDDLIRHECTQSRLVESAARSLNQPFFRGNLRRLADSPYLYGCDILSTATLKKDYLNKYKNTKRTPFTVAELDIETDTVNEETFQHAIMASLSMENYCYTAVVGSIIHGIADPLGSLDIATRKYLGERTKDRGEMVYELEIVKNDFEMWRAVLNKAHELKPDFLSIWNMDFEITNFLQMCERYRIDPAKLMSDPSVPDEYKSFEYVRGKDIKVTASNKKMPIKPAAQWHTVFCPASFYVIDQMCSYKQVRTGEQEEQSYALDFLLTRNEVPAKFKHEKADAYTGLAWFAAMQSKYPIEYIVYNRWDCLGPQTLDEKIKDLSISIPELAGTSDFRHVRSQPRRLVDDLHWECLENNMVIGTTGSSLVDEFDEETLERDGWITALQAGILATKGVNIIAESPDITTSIYVAVGDLDVAAAYPNGGAVYNISKDTTSKEIISIEGVAEEDFRIQNMGLTATHVNAVEYCTIMFAFPEIEQLSEAWDQEQAQQPQELALH